MEAHSSNPSSQGHKAVLPWLWERLRLKTVLKITYDQFATTSSQLLILSNNCFMSTDAANLGDMWEASDTNREGMHVLPKGTVTEPHPSSTNLKVQTCSHSHNWRRACYHVSAAPSVCGDGFLARVYADEYGDYWRKARRNGAPTRL